ncbi:toll-like receptor 2 [Pelobates cultripes]|uniref:Monocyte differentiation antigen CD14 n=1 Tax=Pelobates cultripes TaxID=61616 RepID=A0AAD1RQE8_PELCU|nr:toll-like receptor 2 [Pelobates cultripes]
MKISQSFLFLLCITQRMPWVGGDCLYNAVLRYCSCSLVDLTNIVSIVSCIQASSFEFQGGSFIDTQDYILYNVEMEQVLAMIRIPLTKVTFVNVVLSEEFLSTFLKWVYRIPIEVLAFENTKFVGQPSWLYISESPPRISSLRFINISSYPLFDRPATFPALGSWIYKLEELTMKKSNLKSIPCNASLHFKDLTSLDLSENLLDDHDIFSLFCPDAFPMLKTLILRHNNFVNLDTICQTLKKYNQLVQLDLSQNNLSNVSTSFCIWKPSILFLNLSDTGLEEINYNLPQNCDVLDLSYNKLDYLNISLPNLKKLYLSYNKFITIPTTAKLPRLEMLALDGNPIKTLQLGQLQYYKHLNSIKADSIPYLCSCSLNHEIKEIKKTGLILEGWPDGYTCDSPILFQGKLVNDVNLSFFECHKPLLTVVICIVVLLVCIATVICSVKIHRRNKTRSRNMQTGNLSTVKFQS